MVANGNIGPDFPITKGSQQDGNGYVFSTSAFGLFGRTAKEAEANARLIAASPEMYAVIKAAATMNIFGSYACCP